MDDDVLLFADEQEELIEEGNEVWKVLIVDDEEEVHAVTKLVLDGFSFEGKPLLFLSAYSAEEAKRLLQQHSDIALILLDVVMEGADAGLQLVHYIREEMHNQLVRIVLRTGQPGEAPEARVILEYDINDYKEKTELTAQKLLTTLIASLRSYRDLQTIETGLEKIVQASPEIFRMQSMQNFAAGVLTQLIAMLKLNRNSLYLKTSSFAATRQKNGEFNILAATGEFETLMWKDALAVPKEVQERLLPAIAARRSLFLDDYFVLFWQSADEYAYMIYMEGTKRLTELDRRLLDVFCLNVSSAFENLNLQMEMDETQREMFFRLAEVAETRSRETGNHVRRVGEYARLLGSLCGLSDKEVDMLHMAAPMHDIGKLGIPDAILNKPGKLTESEFAVMKGHARIGYDMLKGSEMEMVKAAAIIALQHHEKFDGSGYPNGLVGEDIHIYARITAIADVFDALGCSRVYKEAWPLEKIIAYFEEAKGQHFDPSLVELFFAHWEEVQAIRERFADSV